MRVQDKYGRSLEIIIEKNGDISGGRYDNGESADERTLSWVEENCQGDIKEFMYERGMVDSFGRPRFV